MHPAHVMISTPCTFQFHDRFTILRPRMTSVPASWSEPRCRTSGCGGTYQWDWQMDVPVRKQITQEKENTPMHPAHIMREKHDNLLILSPGNAQGS